MTDKTHDMREAATLLYAEQNMRPDQRKTAYKRLDAIKAKWNIRRLADDPTFEAEWHSLEQRGAMRHE